MKFRTQNRHNTRGRSSRSQVVAATAVWSSLPRRLNFFGSGGRRKEVTWKGDHDDDDDDDDDDILDVTFLDKIRFSTVDAEILCKYPGCVEVSQMTNVLHLAVESKKNGSTWFNHIEISFSPNFW